MFYSLLSVFTQLQLKPKENGLDSATAKRDIGLRPLRFVGKKYALLVISNPLIRQRQANFWVQINRQWEQRGTLVELEAPEKGYKSVSSMILVPFSFLGATKYM